LTDAGPEVSVQINADLVAVAPDDNAIVAIAQKSTGVVYISSNGGSTWGSLSAPTGVAAIYDLAVSAAYSGNNYVAVAGYETTNT